MFEATKWGIDYSRVGLDDVQTQLTDYMEDDDDG